MHAERIVPPETTLRSVFLRAVHQWGERPALWIMGRVWTYRALLDVASSLAGQIIETGAADSHRPCGVLAHRTLAAYVGVLASQLCGMPFVPIHPQYPVWRIRAMLDQARPSALIVDTALQGGLAALLREQGPDPRLVLFDAKEMTRHAACGGDRRWMGRHVLASDTAYIMFTSGSCGRPKGVRVLQSSVMAYLDAIQQLLGLRPDDRSSQMFDSTFDPFVHDLFATWSSGACLYVPQPADLLSMTEFVRRHRLTSWFSVPTAGALARRAMDARPDALSSLRLVLFCGEALTPSIAERWQQAAPHATLYNLYGPTETTIAVTGFRCDPGRMPASLATVPIGFPFPGQFIAVLDDRGVLVEGNTIGELVVAGPQVSAGYLHDSPADAAAFFEAELDGNLRRWYRTGDLVSLDAQLGLIFHGRRDLQVKISGYRVELLEVEAVLREAAECDIVAAIPWVPAGEGSARALVGVVCASAVAPNDIVRRCRERLPVFMAPRQIAVVADVPMNVNGKIDRRELEAQCGALFRPMESSCL